MNRNNTGVNHPKKNVYDNRMNLSETVLKKRGFAYVLKSNAGFLYILPWLIGFMVFKLYPFAAPL